MLHEPIAPDRRGGPGACAWRSPATCPRPSRRRAASSGAPIRCGRPRRGTRATAAAATRRVHPGHRHAAARGQRLRRPLHPVDGAVQAPRGVRRRPQRLPRRGARPAPRAPRRAAGRRPAGRRRGRVLRGPRRRPPSRGERPHSQRRTRRARRPRAARHRRRRRCPSRSCATAPTTGFCSPTIGARGPRALRRERPAEARAARDGGRHRARRVRRGAGRRGLERAARSWLRCPTTSRATRPSCAPRSA